MQVRPGRSPARRLLVAAAVAAVVVAVDQVTKTWAVHRLSRSSIHVVWKLDLQLAYNTGSAFSFAQGWAPVLGGIAVVVVAVLLVSVRRTESDAMAASVGLIVGGAVGNLADRVFRGYHGGVVDFIALHFWPTFNVADSCIVVGSVLVALQLRRRPGPEPTRVDTPEPVSGDDGTTDSS
jgi:signal peptidase II